MTRFDPDQPAPSPSRRLGRRVHLHTSAAAETRSLGRRIGQRIREPLTLALTGSLGSGKTCLVQGIARGLGVRATVNSPTFVLMKRYRGRLMLYHWDWYRLESEDDLESTGYGDLPMQDGVTVIEWADRFPDRIPKPFLLIELRHDGPASREIQLEIKGRSKSLGELLREVKSRWETRR